MEYIFNKNEKETDAPLTSNSNNYNSFWIDCNGANTRDANGIVQGGQPGYTYAWRNSFGGPNNPNLAFPTSSNKKENFWINKPDKEKMAKLLNYLYKIEFSDWKLVVKEWSKHFVIHDYKNEIYKNILRKENLI